LIRKTWSRLQQQPAVNDYGPFVDKSHYVNRGVRVFLRIFELEPEARSVFVDFPPSQMIASPVFRSHAKRFMTAVEMTVRSLDALDVIVAPTLVRLGRRHVAFAGFQPRYMVVFERAMDDTWRRELGRRRYSGDTRRAWCKLFRFLTTRVTEGYNEALSDRTTAAQSGNFDGKTLPQSNGTDQVATVQKNN